MTTRLELNIGSLNSPSATLNDEKAVSNADGDVVRLLAKFGADINVKTRLGYTPLIYAIVTRKSVMTSTLVALGADLNVRINGTTPDESGFLPIHIAAGYGQSETIRVLAAKGASVNARSDNGTTALHLAAMRNDVDSVRELLRLGANRSIANDRGQTPLALARASNSDRVVTLLSEPEKVR